MDKNTFTARVATVGIPYTENEFKDTKNNPNPNPPYICFLWHEEDAGPDFHPKMLVDVEGVLELYVHFDSSVEGRDTSLEERIEEVVLYDMPCIKEVATISEENLAQISYEFIFREKR